MKDEIIAMIADDEGHLRASLRRRLAEIWPELVIAAEARNGIEALDTAAEHEPDIAFLDIRMPGMDGLEVARRLNGRCHLVFVTAYDEYAVDAFERDAVDYLLKPVTDERLAQSVARLQRHLTLERPRQFGGLLDDLAQRIGGTSPDPLKWIRAGVSGEVKLVPVEEVYCFIAADKYTSVLTEAGDLLIRKSIRELEGELEPQQFWRVHRNAIVNLAAVSGGYRDEQGRLRLRIQGLIEGLPVSRSYAHRFRQM